MLEVYYYLLQQPSKGVNPTTATNTTSNNTAPTQSNMQVDMGYSGRGTNRDPEQVWLIIMLFNSETTVFLPTLWPIHINHQWAIIKGYGAGGVAQAVQNKRERDGVESGYSTQNRDEREKESGSKETAKTEGDQIQYIDGEGCQVWRPQVNTIKDRNWIFGRGEVVQNKDQLVNHPNQQPLDPKNQRILVVFATKITLFLVISFDVKGSQLFIL